MSKKVVTNITDSLLIYNYMHKLKKYWDSNWKDIAIIIVVLFVSIYPRIWKLETLPPIIVDEPANLRDITKINGVLNPVEFHWDYSKAYLVHLLPFILIKLKLFASDLYALRFSSVLVSLASLVPFYLLAKRETNRIVALSTTLLFSFGYYFLQFSRVGWVDVTAVVFAGITIMYLAFLWKETGKSWYVYLGAFLSGILFYSYRSGLIYIVTFFIFIVIESLLDKSCKLVRIVKLITISLAVFFITALPWLAKITNNWDQYSLRGRVVYINNAPLPYNGQVNHIDIVKYQISTSIKSWILLEAVDGGGQENSRYLPLTKSPVNIFVKLSFWLGIGIALIKIRRYYPYLIIITLGIIAGQIMTSYPPNGARALAFLPMIYLISAIAIYHVYKALNYDKIVLTIILIVSLLFAFLDFQFYQAWMGWIKV